MLFADLGERALEIDLADAFVETGALSPPLRDAHRNAAEGFFVVFGLEQKAGLACVLEGLIELFELRTEERRAALLRLVEDSARSDGEVHPLFRERTVIEAFGERSSGVLKLDADADARQ